MFFSCPEIKINSPVLNNQNLYHSLPEQYTSIKDTEEENGFILIDFLKEYTSSDEDEQFEGDFKKESLVTKKMFENLGKEMLNKQSN